jgi:predicted MFS family arabinose efflux permease
MPLGAALGGAVGELLGLRAVFLIAGALVLLSFLLLPAVTEAKLRAVEAGSGDAGRAGADAEQPQA